MISADGRYVGFYSTASNLVSGDTNSYYDVFIRDTQAGTTSRVSVDSSGNQVTGSSTHLSISGDGRFVAFQSEAPGLVPADTNYAPDIFVRDTQASTTTRISVSPAGAQAVGSSQFPAISADGRYVTYSSSASNLVTADTNGFEDVFVYGATTGSSVLGDQLGEPGLAERRSGRVSAGVGRPHRLARDGRFRRGRRLRDLHVDARDRRAAADHQHDG